MPSFQYEALGKSGFQTTDAIEADSIEQATEQLRERGLHPLSILPIDNAGGSKKGNGDPTRLPWQVVLVAIAIGAAFPLLKYKSLGVESGQLPLVMAGSAALFGVTAAMLVGVSYAKSAGMRALLLVGGILAIVIGGTFLIASFLD